MKSYIYYKSKTLYRMRFKMIGCMFTYRNHIGFIEFVIENKKAVVYCLGIKDLQGMKYFSLYAMYDLENKGLPLLLFLLCI